MNEKSKLWGVRATKLYTKTVEISEKWAEQEKNTWARKARREKSKGSKEARVDLL